MILKALCFFVSFSLVVPSAGWSHETLPSEILIPHSEISAESQSRDESEIPFEDLNAAGTFFESDSPLSPVEASQNSPIISVLSQTLPPEANFITRTSTGLYEMTLDNYFDSLRQAVMPASATSQFDELELVNIEFAALKSRAVEGLASLYDFLIFLPTESARLELPNLNFAGSFGVQGFGAADKDNIQGLGELGSDDALIQKLNNTFGPLFEDNFSAFLAEAEQRSTHQGTAWVDFRAISTFIDSRKYEQFVTLQEMAHRWGMHLSATPANENPLKILGRENSHWSVFFDAGTSPMDGLDWRDNGDGTFTLLSAYGFPMSDIAARNYQNQSNAFNDFDLYAMGLLSSAQVASSFVIDTPRTLSGTSLNEENFFDLFEDFSFLLNPTIRGTRRNVGIQDITSINGNRTPSSAASQKNFSAAVVVIKSGTESTSQMDTHRSKVNSLTNSLSSLWNSATRGLSTLSIGPLSGAFNTFQNQAALLFDEAVSAIQSDAASNLNTQVTRAESNQTAIATLENQISDIENLLQPLLARAQNDAVFQQALTPITDRVTALKTSLANLKAPLQQELDEEDALPGEISSRKQNLLSLLNTASTSGILPLGFGVTADNSLFQVEDLYLDLTQDLKRASTAFENQKSALEQELDQLENNLSPDLTVPTGTFLINGGASQTSSGLLNFNMDFSDSKFGPALMRYSTDFGQSWSATQVYASNFPVTAWYSQGSDIRFQVQVCDFFDNCSVAENHILYQYTDTVAPTGSFQINGGAATTSTANLHLEFNFSDTGSRPGFMRYSKDHGQTWSTFYDYTAARDIEERHSQGTQFHLLVQVCDYAWNCSTAENTILYQYPDTAAPTGGFAINGGAETTATGELQLNMNFSDNDSKLGFMRYSKDHGQSWSDFQNYASMLNLSEWHSQGTQFHLLVQACDYAWNCTTAEDTILYEYNDTGVPTGGFEINGGAATTSNGLLTLSLSFQDAETRLGHFRYSLDGGNQWGNWNDYQNSFQIENWPSQGTDFRIWVQACDVAWNCTTENRSILYQYEDSTPPSGSIAINNGAATGSGSTMTVNLQFQENETRLGFMRYTTTNFSEWSSFIPYAASLELPFTTFAAFQVCDVAWNCTVTTDDILPA